MKEGNRSINTVDYFGLFSADQCKPNIKEALIAACAEFRPISAISFVEYGGVITDCSEIEEKPCFKYTFVTSGLVNKVEAGAINASKDQCPGCEIVAVLHTHPRVSREHPDIAPLVGGTPEKAIQEYIVAENKRQDYTPLAT